MVRPKKPSPYIVVDHFRFDRTGDEAALAKYLKQAKPGKRRALMVELMLAGFRQTILKSSSRDLSDPQAPPQKRPRVNTGGTAG